MRGEEEDRPSMLEQIQLLEQTKEKVLGMLNGTKGQSEEDRENVATRIAGFFVEASELFESNFNRIILIYPSFKDTSGFQLLTVFNNEPQPTDLRDLSKRHLWSGKPIIWTSLVFPKDLNGKNSREFINTSMPNAVFLGELSAVRV